MGQVEIIKELLREDGQTLKAIREKTGHNVPGTQALERKGLIRKDYTAPGRGVNIHLINRAEALQFIKS